MTDTEEQSDAKQITQGKVAGTDVTVITHGPEAQDLDDDADELGSDVVHSHLESAIQDVKSDLEGER